MKHSTEPPEVIRARAAEIGELRPIRRGSLVERFVTCGKASCACRDDPAARHGPYFSLSYLVDGKLKTRWVPAAQVATMRQQIEAGRVFRDATEVYWQGCERVADDVLEGLAASSAQDAEKGGSRRASPRRSSPRRKRS